MKFTFTTFLFFITTLIFAQQVSDSVMLKRIFDEELTRGQAYSNLRELCKGYGKRLSGSPGAAGAVEWSYAKMQTYGFDSVYRQEVMVPHWVRGKKETAGYRVGKGGKELPVAICALGGSIATPENGVAGEVIEVKSFEELRALGEGKVKGKIVFFNRPMDDTRINTFAAYGGAVNQRGGGAREAGRLGAVAVIVRTMSVGINPYPHTGAMWKYVDSIPKIPACAISTLHAEQLSKDLKANPNLVFKYTMSCAWLPETLSHNVICEIRGSEHPEEIIVMGGHLDAWDMAEGAHDDGAGVVQCLEALRLMKQLGIQPKHTIRCVFFMNEENGLRGGTTYAAVAKAKSEKHILALESDEGGFTPRGFGFDVKGDTLERLLKLKDLFAPYYMSDFHEGGGGSDIGPLRDQGCVTMGLTPDTQRYFDFHHAETDVFEAVNKRELELGAAGIASVIYLIDKYGL
jgi:carboxypeptidase Q